MNPIKIISLLCIVLLVGILETEAQVAISPDTKVIDEVTWTKLDPNYYPVKDGHYQVIDDNLMKIAVGNTRFNVTSSVPKYAVGDILKGYEWGYLEAGNETVVIDTRLLIRGNKLCKPLKRLSFGRWNADCIDYKNESVSFTQLDKNTVIVNWTGVLDPTYNNANITDFLYWWNFSNLTSGHWYDYNAVQMDQGISAYSSSNQCTDNTSCLYWEEPGTSLADFTANWNYNSSGSIVLEVNFDTLETSGWGHLGGIYSNDLFAVRTDGSNNIICQFRETDGWISNTILTSASVQTNTSYVFYCQYNETSVCSGYNENSLTCSNTRNADIYGNGVNGGIGTSLDTAIFYSSGFVMYDKFLNSDERQEAFNCLSTRGNIIDGCTAATGGETFCTFSTSGSRATITGPGRFNLNSSHTGYTDYTITSCEVTLSEDFTI